ncbi:MAG: phage head morphogenesis protein [Candidatus Gracilibacteria bacterium]|nr:phage head morphogenesis protein [Candidatus Gracilibacteria bacterium]
MLNRKIYDNFEEKFKILTSKNINKINQKINFGEENFYDKNIENNFISVLNPHLEEIINLGKNAINSNKITEKSEESKSNILGINKEVLGIWDENFPSFLTQNNSQNSNNNNNNENNKNLDEIFGGPKMEKLPEIINIFPENNQKILPNIRKYDENGFLKTPKMQFLSSKNNFQNSIQDLLISNNPLEIAKNIYQNQVKYIEKIINKFKENPDFLEVIGEELEKIVNSKRNKNYCDCIINTLFHNNKTACFQAFLEENNLKGYKKRITKNDSRVESICEYNAMQGYIPFSDNFISGHFSPPGHYGCRCHLEFKTEENLDFSIEKYILKNKQITDLMEEERIQKQQEKRKKEAEKERKRKEREEKNIKNHDITELFEEKLKEADNETNIVNYIPNNKTNGKFDVKNDENFKKCVDEDGFVNLYGKKVKLDEVGNFFIGYNGDKSGFNIHFINLGGEGYELLFKGTKDLTDEFRDRRFYKAGAVYSQLKPYLETKEEKNNVFINLMSEAQNESINIDDIGKKYLDYYIRNKTKREFEKTMKKDLNKEVIKYFNPKVYEKINPQK